MEVALFPIPNCVTFPGQTVSLHVFEPRYRAMVRECVGSGRPLAVCGVKRLIERPRTEISLHANLSTFEPVSVVSFGRAEIQETLADGRLMVEVTMAQRAKILKLTQEEPYYLAEAERLADAEAPASAQQALLRAELSARFEALWQSAKRDHSPPPFPLDSLSFGQLSFQILGFLQTDPVLAQLLLEEQNPERRAAIVLDILCALEARAA